MREYTQRVSPEHIPETGESAQPRLLLKCLAAEGGETDIVQLSVACARELYDRPVTTLPPETRRQLYRSCRESVIETLADQNLVEYCPADGTVKLLVTGDTDRVAP